MNILVKSKTILIYLSLTVLLLFMIQSTFLLIEYSNVNIGSPYWDYLRFLFDFGAENNIPTIFSFICWVICALYLLLLSINERKNGGFSKYWMGLAVLFGYFSIDEFLSIHENISPNLQLYLNTSGVFYFAWIIPYGILILILLIVYYRVFLSIPTRIKKLFMISATIFIGGSIGIEMSEAYFFSLYGQTDLCYILLSYLEELFEMLGLVCFIYSLNCYLTLKSVNITLSFKDNK